MKYTKLVAAFLAACTFAFSPLQAAENQEGKAKRPDSFSEVGLSPEQKVQVEELQKSIQPLRKEAVELKDREKMQAAQKKFQAGLAKILDEEQMKKYLEVIAKRREAAKAKKRKSKSEEKKSE